MTPTTSNLMKAKESPVMTVTPRLPPNQPDGGQLKINQKAQYWQILHHSVPSQTERREELGEMPLSAGFDEFLDCSDILPLNSTVANRFSEQLKYSEKDLSGIIVSGARTQQNNNKRKNWSYEGSDSEVRRVKRVRPLELMTGSLPPPPSSSLSLTPPLTPQPPPYPPYFPSYGLQQQQQPYFQYDMTQLSPGYKESQYQYSAQYSAQNPSHPASCNRTAAVSSSVSAALSFLYEKSLASVRRWRENGLTVQLFYCVVCSFPADSEERMKAHIESLHQDLSRGGKEGMAASKPGVERCKGCSKELPSKAGLERHEEECEEVRPYRCEHCGRTFLLSARLKHHRAHCQSGPRPAVFQCKVCSKQFGRRDVYLLHLPVHAFYL